MSFDKIKAMRNAERFLAQGKIRAAISEYKRVIENDQNDYSTLNMLGDLCAKASEPDEAVRYFTQVAEHYGKQGFAQKAIAIYNKISRLKPDSLEVSAKLAQLYQTKGSVAEARSHYTTLAEQYSRIGRKTEALAVWKQIASLDPNNTEIYLKIADACWHDHQKEEAANAYIEGGNRLKAQKQFESAVTAFSRALEIRPEDMLALRGFVDSQVNLGYADDAAKTLERFLAKQPHNREVMYLLVDCYIDMESLADAEKTVIKLIEQEPANYPKLLDLVKVYLRNSSLEAAVRTLTMASEHLLVGGQTEILEKFINDVLAKNPEHLGALRLLVRFHSWQRDEAKIKSSLDRLAEAAKLNGAFDDEKNSLSQLIMISPQNSSYAQRLHELNALDGASYTAPNQPLGDDSGREIPTFESFSGLGQEDEERAQSDAVVAEYGSDLGSSNGYVKGSANASRRAKSSDSGKEFHFEGEAEEIEVIEVGLSVIEIDSENLLPDDVDREVGAEAIGKRDLTEFELNKLEGELEGIDFYVAQGFKDLAEKSLLDIESRFGQHPEITKLRESLVSEEQKVAGSEDVCDYQVEVDLSSKTEDSSIVESGFEDEKIEAAAAVEPIETPSSFNQSGSNLLEEIKSEFGIVENKQTDEIEDDSYETAYETGIVYREMGLIEEAIRKFQIAVKLVSPLDSGRSFFACCNLLGHCFMEKQMPKIALTWYQRSLEAKNLTEDETHALYYELANAHEKAGDHEKAIEKFEQIYGLNVSFRDVGVRLQSLRKN